MLGAMSGTSADGVDVALVRVTGRGLGMKAELLHHVAAPYASNLKQQIFSARQSGVIKLVDLAQLACDVTLVYADAVNHLLRQTGTHRDSIAAIGAHGQTLFHEPPNTIQWFDPSLLAHQTGIAVVSDFRRADCAAGGQGAPLVPFADYILFRHPTVSRVLLNLGGIANLTYLKAGGTIDEVIAFDTGPGNCVIDSLMRESGSGEGIDIGGQRAARGVAHFPTAFLAIRNWKHVFRPPPKSADTPEMIAAFRSAQTQLLESATLDDRLATACMMSALGVELAMHHLPAPAEEIIVSGGGVHNRTLLREIESCLKRGLSTTAELGIGAEAKEALAFAILAAATLDGEPSNVPGVTGASRRSVLGSITPKAMR